MLLIYNNMIDKARREYLIARIKANSIVMPNGCIEWQGTKTHKGYGLIRFAIKYGDGYNASLPAHRAHYMAHHDVILSRDQFVCHKCDNPACVNIKHLFVGTAKDNVHDMWSKGRAVTRKRVKDKKKRKQRQTYTIEQIMTIIQAHDWKRAAFDMDMSENYAWCLRTGRHNRNLSIPNADV